MAAEQGEVEAEVTLGSCLLTGCGVPKDMTAGLAYIEKAGAGRGRRLNPFKSENQSTTDQIMDTNQIM
jgi:TPR repeat protein